MGWAAQGRLTNVRGQDENGEQERGPKPDHTPEADPGQPDQLGLGSVAMGRMLGLCRSVCPNARKRK